MNRILVSCFLVAFLFGCIGCVSRTVIGVGPLHFGGRTEIHEFRKPSVETTEREARVTLGYLSAGAIGYIENDPLVSLDSVTGPTNVVEPPLAN